MAPASFSTLFDKSMAEYDTLAQAIHVLAVVIWIGLGWTRLPPENREGLDEIAAGLRRDRVQVF